MNKKRAFYKFINKIFCNHIIQIKRWHYTHGPFGYDLHIEAEFECIMCGKLFYYYIFDINQMKDFAQKFSSKQWR